MFAIAQGIRRLAVQAPGGVVAVDRMVGPVGQGWRDGSLGYMDTWCLIPTDDARDAESFKGYLELFRQGREGILDPVLVAEDSKRSFRGFVLGGHHRVAAAFAAGKKVQIALLRTTEEVRRYVREGLVAELAQKVDIDALIEDCERRSRRLSFYQARWAAWLEGLPGV